LFTFCEKVVEKCYILNITLTVDYFFAVVYQRNFYIVYVYK